MHATTTLSVLAAALLLAGCAQPSALDTAATPPQGAAGGPSPVALYLQGDLTLAPAPPASESSVAIAFPVNGPWVESADYPAWTAQLSAAAPNGTANVTLFMTASSASAAANVVPFFNALPEMTLVLSDGANESSAPGHGPAILRAGETAEIHAQVPVDGLILGPGASLSLRVIHYYTHVVGAAEVRFLMGPEHPARVELAP